MTDSCLSIDLVSRYTAAEATGSERGEVEAHAAACEGCRLALAASGLAMGPGSKEEEALIGWIASTRPVSALVADLGLGTASLPSRVGVPAPGRREASVHGLRPVARGGEATRRAGRVRWASGLAAAIAAALALVFFLPGGSGEPMALELKSRAAEGRPAHLSSYAPFQPMRGDGDSDEELTDLEGRLVTRRHKDRAEADSLLTAFYLWRGADGDQARARAILDTRTPSAARENDRGVLLLSMHQPEAALAAFEKAMRMEPQLKPALFNRAVALEALGRREQAISAWESYLSQSQKERDGWVEEARQRLQSLKR